MRRLNIRSCGVILILAFIVCTMFTWVRPGPESAGLSQADQLGYVIIPVVICFCGIWNDQFRFGSRVLLIIMGYVLLYLSVYILIKNSGLMMNIGEIEFVETVTWLTPMFYVSMAVSVVSFIADMIIVLGDRNNNN